MNLVELVEDEQHPSPCRHGNIVDGHACYCHHGQGPRKCPIWRHYGEHDLTRWHNRGDWDADEWSGGCRFFVANAPDVGREEA
jgi:hypothetical protein